MTTLRNRRVVVGPRGGRVVLPTPCLSCVSWRSCGYGGATAFLGCDSWVDLEGHRVALDVDEPVPEVAQGELW